MADKEVKRKSEMQFVGQDSDEARAAVMRQRDLKKKEGALRKTQKRLKSMKLDDAAYAATQEEEAQLEKEIRELTGGGSGEAAATTAAPVSKGQEVARSATASVPAAAAAAAVVEDVEANGARLKAIVEQAIQANRAEFPIRPRESLVHPRVAEVAILMDEMLIVGGNARALAMIAAFREMFRTTSILAGSSLMDVNTQAFVELVERNFAFLCRKREANAGMRYVKEVVVRRVVALRDEVVNHQNRDQGTAPGSSSSRNGSSTAVSAIARSATIAGGGGAHSFAGNARDVALQVLDMVEAEIRMSVKSIVEERSLPYVSSNDTILVFGRSSVVEFILLSRAEMAERKPKMVIVVDSAPLFEGRELAHKLSEAGIHVTYGLITAACTLMPKCTRVFIGASRVLQNGDVFGRCGTALIAACAKSFRKPVLCFAESYKFVSEVWIGNLAQNTKLTDIREAAAGSPFDNAAAAAACRSPLTYSTPPSQPVSAVCGKGSGGALTPPSAFGGGGAFASSFSAGGVVPPASTFGAAASSSKDSGYLYDLAPAAYVDMIICEMGCLHTSAIIAAIKDREGRDESPAMYMAYKNSL